MGIARVILCIYYVSPSAPVSVPLSVPSVSSTQQPPGSMGRVRQLKTARLLPLVSWSSVAALTHPSSRGALRAIPSSPHPPTPYLPKQAGRLNRGEGVPSTDKLPLPMVIPRRLPIRREGRGRGVGSPGFWFIYLSSTGGFFSGSASVTAVLAVLFYPSKGRGRGRYVCV